MVFRSLLPTVAAVLVMLGAGFAGAVLTSHPAEAGKAASNREAAISSYRRARPTVRGFVARRGG